MDDETKRCPLCGGALIEGEVYMASIRTASLWWRSAERFQKKNPLRLFGRTFFAESKLDYRLFSSHGSIFTEETETGCRGAQLCRACGKVFAVLDIAHKERL